MARENKQKLSLSLLDSFLNTEKVIYTETMDLATETCYGCIAVLKEILMDPPKEFIEDGNLTLLYLLASEAVTILFTFDLNTLDIDNVAELVSRFEDSGFFLRMADLTREGKRYMADEPKQDWIFPMVGQLEFVDHLVENLEELVITKSDSIAPLKFFRFKLIKALQYFSSHFIAMSQEDKEQPDLKYLLKEITNSAYFVEGIIDHFMVREFPIWYYMQLLFDNLYIIQNCERQLRRKLGDMPHNKWDSTHFYSDGFNLAIFAMVEQSHDKCLKILNHKHMVTQYKVHSWCVCSSYRERKKEVFLQLLQNALLQQSGVEYSHNISLMSQDELETLVRELLINKTSLIILEDVQDIDTVHDILRVLPNPGYSGFIVVETRSPELADQCKQIFPKSLSNNLLTSKLTTNLRSTKSDGDIADVVGFKKEIDTVLELLVQESAKLHLISIFGMAGLGKTTVAKRLYNDRSVIEHFDRRAWCYVSQVYETKQLFLELLHHTVPHSDTLRHMNDVELAELLRKSLLGRRFLIVLDDIWSIGAWNDLRRYFPNDKNGSRIIFTTRLHNFPSESGSIQQRLGNLSENECWELLTKKVFEKKNCPDELSQVGTQIAKRCNGLPLSVVLVAGVLAETEKTIDRWTQILESLPARILDDANEHGKLIIEMSYTHLPDYLKPCFLYFGHFLKDREVSVSKLIRMLIAEGFIRHTELKILENVAEDCLMELIGRSLVTVSQEKSNGGVKSCRIHDLIHDFCLSKAEEEKFLLQIHGYNDHFPSSDDYEDYGMDPNYHFSSSASIKYFRYRICINSKRNHFTMLKPSGPQVRSLSFIPASDTHPSYPYDISFIFHNFKLLTKLDLEDINIGVSFKAILELIHLRYLAVQGYIKFIPSSIANIWKLETFLVKNLSAKDVEVPDAICDMVKLRHVHINGSASFKLDPSRSEESSILDNLQTLSTPVLTHGGDMEKILRRVKGIKKLKCIFLDSSDDNTNCNKFPEMGFLSQLESLKLSYGGIERSLCEFNFPPNLTKLTLFNFWKPWSEINQLARLKNLEVLKLLGNAFAGESWIMEDEVFSELKFLKLDTLDIEEWIAKQENFPQLEHLILNQCEKLENIPSRVGDITTLKMIEVIWCNESVAVSAREIEEDQMNFGHVVKINVHPDVVVS